MTDSNRKETKRDRTKVSKKMAADKDLPVYDIAIREQLPIKANTPIGPKTEVNDMLLSMYNSLLDSNSVHSRLAHTIVPGVPVIAHTPDQTIVLSHRGSHQRIVAKDSDAKHVHLLPISAEMLKGIKMYAQSLISMANFRASQQRELTLMYCVAVVLTGEIEGTSQTTVVFRSDIGLLMDRGNISVVRFGFTRSKPLAEYTFAAEAIQD